MDSPPVWHDWQLACFVFVINDVIDEAQEAEAIQVLNAIYDMREHQSNRKAETIATIAHSLAMLYFILHDIEKVLRAWLNNVNVHSLLLTWDSMSPSNTIICVYVINKTFEVNRGKQLRLQSVWFT